MNNGGETSARPADGVWVPRPGWLVGPLSQVPAAGSTTSSLESPASWRCPRRGVGQELTDRPGGGVIKVILVVTQ